MNTLAKKICLTLVLGAVALVAGISQSWAHGEVAQEPFLRMRSIQWFDIAWSADKIKVNDEMILSGKFRVFEDWPRALTEPKVAFINVATPGPVFHRMRIEIGGETQFFSGPLLMGRDYDFKITLRGRVPGRYHVHTMVNMLTNGPVAGPGQWVEITGNHADYTNPIKTLTNKTFEADTVGLANGVTWHIVWAILAVAWLGYWLAQPLFLARHRALQAGRVDVLTTKGDLTFGAIMLVVSLSLIAFGYMKAVGDHPNVVALQAGQANFMPMPELPKLVTAKVQEADYDVPGRVMRIKTEVTNSGTQPVRLAEFSTAGVRFLNAKSDIPLDNPKYPKEMLAPDGLEFDNQEPIAPGETRIMNLIMEDVIWETQRLADMVNDPDSKLGGLLMFYDTDNTRHIASISGTVIPIFKK
jgi:methane/ammonia monooxygenase subunit B